jgi:hypothetical protein
MRVGLCEMCGTSIFYGLTGRDQMTPFDAEPNNAGVWEIVKFLGRLPVMGRTRPESGASRYWTHFATCVLVAARRRPGFHAPTIVPAK